MNITCAICRDLIVESSEVVTISCGHVFHQICLNTWIERSLTCPQCRIPCTQESIHRVYFNLANTDHIVDDVVTLQSKVDNMCLELNAKEDEVRFYIYKYSTVKAENNSLYQALKNSVKIQRAIVRRLESQFEPDFLERHEQLEKISSLDKELRELKLELLILKGTLRETERKMIMFRNNFNLAQYQARLCRRIIDASEPTTRKLRLELETCRNTFQQRIEQLRNYILELTERSGDRDAYIKMILNEKPLPGNSITSEEMNSPSIDEQVLRILDSRLPSTYFEVSNVDINSSEISENSTQPPIGTRNANIIES